MDLFDPHLLDASPRTINHGNSDRFDNAQVFTGNNFVAMGGQNNATKMRSRFHTRDIPQTTQLSSGTALCVTLIEIPHAQHNGEGTSLERYIAFLLSLLIIWRRTSSLVFNAASRTFSLSSTFLRATAFLSLLAAADVHAIQKTKFCDLVLMLVSLFLCSGQSE